MTETIKIDVWSDIACPWCYIGKRNLEKGLASTAADDDAPVVDVEFHSYELAPDTPADFEGDEAQYLSEHKGIGREQAEQMMERVTEVAAQAGLQFRFDLLRHVNTVKAHEVLHLAKEAGRQLEMAERLMAAYFTEGRRLSDDEELVALAQEVGIEAERTRSALATGRYRDAVRADEAQAAAYGINGVPFFVIDGKYGVSGAQPAEAFAQIARQVWSERRSAPVQG